MACIHNHGQDSNDLPQRAEVYWSGKRMEVRANNGRTLVEVEFTDKENMILSAIDRTGRAYRKRSFSGEQLAALLTMFIAAEVAATA